MFWGAEISQKYFVVFSAPSQKAQDVGLFFVIDYANFI